MLVRTHRTSLVVAAAAVGLAGCVTAPRSPVTFPDYGNHHVLPTMPPDAETGSAPGRDTGAALGRAINITPLSTYQDQWSEATAAGAEFADAYTRLLIYSDMAGSEGEGGVPDPLGYQKRNWFARAMVDRDYAVNLTAKVNAGPFEATVPLATISHHSGSEGEKWGRAIHHSRQSFPLFLVPASGSASTPTVKISVSGDRSYDSRAAATAVQVALGVAKITQTSSPVITALTEKESRDQARALDEAISRLFASGLTEDHWTDRDLRYWSASNGRPRGARITFAIPDKSGDWNSTPRPVGTWTVTFDYPRPSVFSDWRICQSGLPRCAGSRRLAETQVLGEVNAGQVLNFPIAPGEQGLGTVRALIAQKDWYVAAQVGLATADKRTAAASTMCRMIVNEMTGLGLNGFDAGIVVWAVARGMPLPASAAVEKAPECKRHMDRVESAQRA